MAMVPWPTTFRAGQRRETMTPKGSLGSSEAACSNLQPPASTIMELLPAKPSVLGPAEMYSTLPPARHFTGLNAMMGRQWETERRLLSAAVYPYGILMGLIRRGMSVYRIS